jgi:hypothetical protein
MMTSSMSGSSSQSCVGVGGTTQTTSGTPEVTISIVRSANAVTIRSRALGSVGPIGPSAGSHWRFAASLTVDMSTTTSGRSWRMASGITSVRVRRELSSTPSRSKLAISASGTNVQP